MGKHANALRYFMFIFRRAFAFISFKKAEETLASLWQAEPFFIIEWCSSNPLNAFCYEDQDKDESMYEHVEKWDGPYLLSLHGMESGVHSYKIFFRNSITAIKQMAQDYQSWKNTNKNFLKCLWFMKMSDRAVINMAMNSSICKTKDGASIFLATFKQKKEKAAHLVSVPMPVRKAISGLMDANDKENSRNKWTLAIVILIVLLILPFGIINFAIENYNSFNELCKINGWEQTVATVTSSETKEVTTTRTRKGRIRISKSRQSYSHYDFSVSGNIYNGVCRVASELAPGSKLIVRYDKIDPRNNCANDYRRTLGMSIIFGVVALLLFTWLFIALVRCLLRNIFSCKGIRIG